jgi:hypothetical protein
MQRRVCGLQKDEVTITIVCRKLHKEEHHNFYCSVNIARMIKSRQMRCVGHVACLEERMNSYTILVWISVEATPLETLGIMLKYVLEKLVMKMRTGMICLSIGPDDGFFS